MGNPEQSACLLQRPACSKSPWHTVESWSILNQTLPHGAPLVHLFLCTRLFQCFLSAIKKGLSFNWGSGVGGIFNMLCRLQSISLTHFFAATELIRQWGKQCRRRKWWGWRRWRGHSSSESRLREWDWLGFWEWRQRKRRRRSEAKATGSQGKCVVQKFSLIIKICYWCEYKKTLLVIVNGTEGSTWL